MMKRLILICGSLLVTASAFAQCNGAVTCGQAGGNLGGYKPDTRTAADFEKLCQDNLAKDGTALLKAKIANDKALNQTARNNAAVTLQQVEADAQCKNVCKQYGEDRYQWGMYVSAGVAYTSEPAKSLQQKWGGKPEPAMPGDAQFKSCYGMSKFDNWCPSPDKSGPLADIGNGPARLNNYIDGTTVCAQPGAGFTILNFTSDQLKYKSECAKPNIVDALVRFTEETNCMTQMAKTFAKVITMPNQGIIKKP